MLDNTQTISSKIEMRFFNPKSKERVSIDVKVKTIGIDEMLKVFLDRPFEEVVDILVDNNITEVNRNDITDVYFFDSDEEEPIHRIQYEMREKSSDYDYQIRLTSLPNKTIGSQMIN